MTPSFATIQFHCFQIDLIWGHRSSGLTNSTITHSHTTITLCFNNLLCSGRTNSLPEAYHFVSIFITSNKLRTHSHRSSNFLDVSIESNTGRPLSVLLKSISVTLPSSHLAQCGTVLAGSHFIFVSKNIAKFKNDWEKLFMKVGLLKGGGEPELLECKLVTVVRIGYVRNTNNIWHLAHVLQVE